MGAARKLTALALCAGLLHWVSGGATAATQPQADRWADWSHRAPLAAAAMPEKGLVELALTPDVLDLARADLGDLRVVSEAGEEVPYVLRTAAGAAEAVPRQARLYNHTYLPGRQASVVADFGDDLLKDRIQVVTGGTDFRRRVRVEGSDDGQRWQTVKDGDLLVRVDAGPVDFQKNVVRIPPNAQRYLRVTVQNGPDDPRRIKFRSVSAWQVVRTEPEVDSVPIVAQRVVENQTEGRTEILLDLNHRNLLLHDLTLHFGNADFFRGIRVLGRPREERVVRVPLEDGTTREKTVPEPWVGLAFGVVYRYSSGGLIEESPALKLGGSRCRYLQVHVLNRDDAPLRFVGAEVTRLRRFLAFQTRPAEACFVYVGNPQAAGPRYDIGHYVDRLRRDGVAAAGLGAVVANPTYMRGGALPWSERCAWVIWLALVAVLVVLALLVRRQLRSVRPD